MSLFVTFIIMSFLTASASCILYSASTLQWRHNGRDCASNHQPHDRLLNRLFRYRSKTLSKLRVTGLCVGVNSPHKWTVTRKMFSFDDVIMNCWTWYGKLVATTGTTDLVIYHRFRMTKTPLKMDFIYWLLVRFYNELQELNKGQKFSSSCNACLNWQARLRTH